MSGPRRASLRALAKINLSLKVLDKRPDGYHELRTIFQTISLGDTLEIECRPVRRTRLTLASNVDIPNNLVVRAAERLLEETGAKAEIGFRLTKRIPAGAGMGGGSSDAAAVLLALPALLGRHVPLDRLKELAEDLGSDVPFFLLGGTALGLGRGTELHPLPDAPEWHGLAVFPDFEVSTAAAYKGLRRKLTTGLQSSTMRKFEALSWSVGRALDTETWSALAENDFEGFVRSEYPEWARIRRRLEGLGARPVLMSGSGSSLFGIFTNRQQLAKARLECAKWRTATFSLVSRARYRRIWRGSLGGHAEGDAWPPRSRYAR